MCVEHAHAARELAQLLSPDIGTVLPRARRLMLEARANLEQWRVAVLRSDALEDDERQMIQMVMGVARSDLETSYGMLPRTPQAENAPETLEYALRRTRRALVAVLLEIGRLRDDDDALIRLQREDLDAALTTRQAYSRVLLRIETEQGSVDDRLEQARSAIDELLEQSAAAEIRLSDRATFAALSERIRQWQDGSPPAEGSQLWSEVASVFALVRAINQREVLRNHDRAVVQGLIFGVDERDSSTLLARWGELIALSGLDAALDRLLAKPLAAIDEHDLSKAVERLRTLAAVLGI